MERLTRLIVKAEPILQAALAAEPSELLLPIAPQPSRKSTMAAPKMARDIAQLWQQGIRSGAPV